MTDGADETGPVDSTIRGTTRRQVLKLGGGGLVAAWAAFALGSWPADATTMPALDYTSPKTFDDFYSAFVRSGVLGQATDYNDVLGALAWGQTYVQQGQLRVYEAYGRRADLDAVMRNIDGVLSTRDSERGVRDYRGLSLPAWRAGNPYTVGAVNLPDGNGRDSLQVRSVKKPIETVNSYTSHTLDVTPLIHVDVTTGAQPDSFDLRVSHATLGTVDVLDNLTMDTVAARVSQAWPTQNLITVQDLRGQTNAGVPAAGSFTMASQQCVFAVHTGMITYPIAWAARIILDTPALRRDPALRNKAHEYVSCCEAALAVHDGEWRENSAGEGWYAFPKGLPIDLDGTELPANQFLAVARTMVHLAAITGSARYADRAAKMARTFRNQLALGANGAYTWHYWLDWGHVYNGYTVRDDVSAFRLSFSGATQAEDISHGHIDVDFAVEAHRDGIVFDDVDMRRLAATFTKNIATTTSTGAPTVWSAVDGTGQSGSVAFDELSAHWMPVAPWDSSIFTHVDRTYQADSVSPSATFDGFLVLGIANLAWFAGSRPARTSPR